MAKNTDNSGVVATTEIKDASGALINGFKGPPEQAVTVRGTGDQTLTMYCNSRNVPLQSRAGMRAFTKMQMASQQEWDAIFKKY
jgi:hypothetical protein